MYRRFNSLWLRLLQTGFILWVGFWGSSVQCAFSQEPVDISPILSQVVQENDLPAMVGAVLLDGQIYAAGVAGVRKWGTEVKAQFNDPFHLGSCTKSMTSTLVGMLIEQGKLRWDSTLAELFPEFLDVMNPTYEKITIEQLMQMHSGMPRDVFPDDISLDDYYNLPGATARDQRHYFTVKILQSEEAYQPGEQYLYSNAGYITLGAVIEKITGQNWEDYIQEKIFTPLGMASAGIGTYGSATDIDVPWWHFINEQGVRESVAPKRENDIPPIYGPAGLVHCNVTDWIKYVQVHLNGEADDQILLKRETILRLHQPVYPGVPFLYAAGWVIFEKQWGGETFIFHDGSNSMNLSNLWFSPKLRFAVLAITNQGGDAAETGIAEAVDALMKKFLPTSNAANWMELR